MSKETLLNFLDVSCEAAPFNSVSYETKKMRLSRYGELLLEWSEKMNLVARSTLPDMWGRHFLDSAQLIKHIPKEAKVFVDLGSGAGFPGLILAVLGAPEVHLVESIGKKAKFLSAVAKGLDLNVTVHNQRIESLRDIEADIVTARALTALPKLLSYSKPFFGKNTKAVFLKGEKTQSELTDAKKYWTFKHKVYPSLTSETGQILIVNDLKVRSPNDKR